MEQTADQILFAMAAYAAYGKTTNYKNYQGLPMPLWPDLTPIIQQAWINAAQAAVAHVMIIIDKDAGTTLEVRYNI